MVCVGWELHKITPYCGFYLWQLLNYNIKYKATKVLDGVHIETNV